MLSPLVVGVESVQGTEGSEGSGDDRQPLYRRVATHVAEEDERTDEHDEVAHGIVLSLAAASDEGEDTDKRRKDQVEQDVKDVVDLSRFHYHTFLDMSVRREVCEGWTTCYS
jgi:hypothetical protein